MWSWPANRDERRERKWKTALSSVFNLVGPFSFSLRLSFSLSRSLYIYVYISFFFHFFLNSFFIRLSLFRWSRLRVRKARGLFSGVRFVWCTELNRMYIGGDWCVELVVAVIFFCVCILSRLYNFAGWIASVFVYPWCLLYSFFWEWGWAWKFVCSLCLWKNIVNRYYNNRSNYDNFFL